MSVCTEVPWEDVAAELPSWVDTDVGSSQVKSRGGRGGEVPWEDVAAELPSWVETDVGSSQVKSRGGRGRRRRRRRHETSSSGSRLRELFLTLSLQQKSVEEEDEEEEHEAEEVDYTKPLDEEEADLLDMRGYRRFWKKCLAPFHGSFQDNTSLRPMRYTEGTIPIDARCEDVLEILSIQVTEVKDGLKWPLHIYGHVAVRDTIDCRRKLLFNRKMDNCQILTEKDSCLLLTGPSRPVMIIDPATFEVDLKVKGETGYEDIVLSLKIFQKRKDDFMLLRSFSSRRSTLEFTFAVLHQAVEATVYSVKVVEGSWPDHVRGRVVSRTASMCEKYIVLLDSQDGRTMPVNCHGKIELSREVVSVELSGQLYVHVVASEADAGVVKEGAAVFTPRKAGRSCCVCDVGFCKVEIVVAWSLFTMMADQQSSTRCLYTE